jgi:hypothetical protein
LKVIGKTIPVTGHEGPEGCEMSRLPHFIGNQLTDGGEIVGLTSQPPFTRRKIPGRVKPVGEPGYFVAS